MTNDEKDDFEKSRREREDPLRKNERVTKFFDDDDDEEEGHTTVV